MHATERDLYFIFLLAGSSSSWESTGVQLDLVIPKRRTYYYFVVAGASTE
jgi:hypothetical protein